MSEAAINEEINNLEFYISYYERKVKHCKVNDQLSDADKYEAMKEVAEDELEKLIQKRDGIQRSN